MDYILERGVEGSTSSTRVSRICRRKRSWKEVYNPPSFPPPPVPQRDAFWVCVCVCVCACWGAAEMLMESVAFCHFSLIPLLGVSGLRREESFRTPWALWKQRQKYGLISELDVCTSLPEKVLPHCMLLQCLWTTGPWGSAHSRCSSNMR